MILNFNRHSDRNKRSTFSSNLPLKSYFLPPLPLFPKGYLARVFWYTFCARKVQNQGWRSTLRKLDCGFRSILHISSNVCLRLNSSAPTILGLLHRYRPPTLTNYHGKGLLALRIRSFYYYVVWTCDQLVGLTFLKRDTTGTQSAGKFFSKNLKNFGSKPKYNEMNPWKKRYGFF